MKYLVPLVLTAACAPLAAADPALQPCGADALQAAVGEPVGAVSLPAGVKVRIIRPGDAVTMDYSPDRLNIELDEDDRVVRVRCG